MANFIPGCQEGRREGARPLFDVLVPTGRTLPPGEPGGQVLLAGVMQQMAELVGEKGAPAEGGLCRRRSPVDQDHRHGSGLPEARGLQVSGLEGHPGDVNSQFLQDPFEIRNRPRSRNQMAPRRLPKAIALFPRRLIRLHRVRPASVGQADRHRQLSGKETTDAARLGTECEQAEIGSLQRGRTRSGSEARETPSGTTVLTSSENTAVDRQRAAQLFELPSSHGVARFDSSDALLRKPRPPGHLRRRGHHLLPALAQSGSKIAHPVLHDSCLQSMNPIISESLLALAPVDVSRGRLHRITA